MSHRYRRRKYHMYTLRSLSVQANLVNSSNVNGMCYTLDDDLITEHEDTFTDLDCLPENITLKLMKT